ncbi:MAG: methyltransferase domain-containing protein, partial [Patescibacteria group bacterium]
LTTVILIFLIFLLVLASLSLVVTFFIAATMFSGAPWVATRATTVRAMCDLAKLKPDDRVLDLGCGDGSILITAAREYGAFGIGVELNPLLAYYARFKMRRAGVQDRVHIIQGNMYDVELPDVDCVMLYLLPKATARIERRLKKRYLHLRVISHGFQLQETLEHSHNTQGKVTVRRYEW